jgi:hypothetical protein
MSNYVLNAPVVDAIKKDSAARITATKRTTAVIDLLVSSGFKSTDLISPKGKDNKSTATPELFASFKDAIVGGYDAATRKLLALPIKAVPVEQKPARLYWQQQIGAIMNDYKRALEKREAQADGADGAKGDTKAPKSAEDKIRLAFETVEKIVQGAEGVNFADGVDAVAFLKALRAINKMVA